MVKVYFIHTSSGPTASDQKNDWLMHVFLRDLNNKQSRLVAREDIASFLLCNGGSVSTNPNLFIADYRRKECFLN